MLRAKSTPGLGGPLWGSNKKGIKALGQLQEIADTAMSKIGIAILVLGLGVALAGCMSQTVEPASEANFSPRDRKLLASAPYAKADIPEPYQRSIVDYHRKEAAGTIVIDTDARYLYYVLPEKKAIRYGVTVGEDALLWSGVAKIGRKEEWPTWTPTADIKRRLGPGIPNFVAPGPHNPLYRIHGTNQPEHIGSAISSGCVRMTNEDVIDLFNRAKMGASVVVLAPTQGDSPFNPQVALGNSDTHKPQ
jgi:lipoprotein-anchoring transpeptidase ErfK/SrfK